MFTYNIKRDFPSMYASDEDTQKLLEVFQFGIATMHDDISTLIDDTSYEKADEPYLDAMLFEKAWIIEIPLSLDLKRKVVKIADAMYQTKGLESGIIDSIFILTGIVVTVSYYSVGGFQVSKVGSDLSYVGKNKTDKKASHYVNSISSAYKFSVNTPILTADELDVITKIIDFMKWKITIYDIKQIL